MASASGDNGALLQTIAKKANAGTALSSQEMKQFVGSKSIMSNIAARLPAHLKANAEKYSKQVLSLFTSNPDLQKCHPMTIVNSLVIASSLGLDLTPQLGQAYIIPYMRKKKVNGKWVEYYEAQFQLGYKGAIDLMYRSGQIADIYGYEVREGDHFVFKKGLNRVLEHEDSNDPNRESKPITHVYMVIRLKDGGAIFDVWSYEKIVNHALQYSKGAIDKDYKTGEIIYGPDGRPQFSKKSPWSTAFVSMAKKSILMSLRSSAPLSVELMNAFAVENSTVRDDEITVEKDTMPAALVEDRPPEIPEAESPVKGEEATTVDDADIFEEAAETPPLPESDENGAV